ncbi:hypothetical protein GCM10010483_50360 [Actinokineospora diospyrosa]
MGPESPDRAVRQCRPSEISDLAVTDPCKQATAVESMASRSLCEALSLLLLGDLNVLEPDHHPAHRGQFAPFEYDFYTDLTHRHGLRDLFRHLHPHEVQHSWARRAELGYRYDHAHGTHALAGDLIACEYLHETRTPTADGTRLTDHSALSVRLALTATTRLLTSDPATAATLAETEPTLF